MSFRYVSNNGDVIEFGVTSPYYADPDVLRTYEVDYDMVRNVVTRFNHDAVAMNFPISIFAETQEEGAELLDRLQQAFDHDVRLNKAGRIEIDEYYTKAFVTTFGLSCEESMGLWEIEVTAKMLLPDPVWILEHKKEFSPSREDERDGLNYPHDFPFNYNSGVVVSQLVNTLSWPCSVRIIIYGAATNPYIYIGDNRYQVNVEVPEGGLLIIDGLDKSQIELRNQYGESENVFHHRISGTQGSGTYIFEQVPSGVNAITWDGSFSFDVILCSERSWVPCST